jgi:predicted MPP superfamily phosphohydrolase
LQLSALSFIHLSDIHFTTVSGDKYDLDHDLRNELLRDLTNSLQQNLGQFAGVLVCGDIAFSGKSEEYQEALTFLAELCSTIGIKEEAVFCVPGNHDVDQSIPRNSAIIKALQDTISAKQTRDEIDKTIGSLSRDTPNNTLLYSPIKCYNEEFAGKFGCYIKPEEPTWSYDFHFDKYTLRLIGLNCVFRQHPDTHFGSIRTA